MSTTTTPTSEEVLADCQKRFGNILRRIATTKAAIRDDRDRFVMSGEQSARYWDQHARERTALWNNLTKYIDYEYCIIEKAIGTDHRGCEDLKKKVDEAYDDCDELARRSQDRNRTMPMGLI